VALARRAPKGIRVTGGRWLLVVVLVVLLLAGGTAVVSLTEEQRKVRAALRAAAARYGLRPDYLDAIARVENLWRLSGTNLAGADGARGGAWGPTQITERTARALGYTGPMSAFNSDANLAAEWTARILVDAHRRKPLDTLADYAAAWNAGRDNADANNDGQLEELPATHSTRAHYLPRAVAALALVKANPVGVA
jgi:hypothetical protein